MSKKTARVIKTGIATMMLAAVLAPHYFINQFQALVAQADMSSSSSIDVWWPTDGSVVTGTQPFMAMVKDASVDEYTMYWQVDNGDKNRMETNNNYPHKEVPVDVTGWNWKGTGPYKITFSAYNQNNEKVVENSVEIYTGEPVTNTITNTDTQTTIAPKAEAAMKTETAPTRSIDVWWPAQNATLEGSQPFKALVPNVNVDEYDFFWQVDGGNLNPMPTNTQDYPHKESLVNVSAWQWRGAGPYKITFVAKDKSGTVIALADRTITISGGSTQTSTETPSPTVNTAPVTVSGMKLFVDPNSPAKGIDKIASQPVAKWLGGWSNISNDVGGVVTAAKNQGAVPIFVAYNIPQRDCGGYSSGGVGSSDAYKSWISNIANTIGGSKAIVILEPDALSQITCLSGTDQDRRYDMLQSAVNTLKSKGNISVYIDAGHSGWISDTDMANRLKRANIAKADGFSLNVSNFKTTGEEVKYGEQLSGKVNGKHFVVDTSRNGNGSNGEWCNPSGRALGDKPTTNTGNGLADAFLWIKQPGESDGNCNGGPSAGTFWADYAWGLANRASW